ncbi:MAG: autotransporter outer membrane beta-barrel domain-containing protein, partial [Chromatiales bacterium]|nr:autotransporter outer membrane beta-barrel domain-containing protein [Chromatiales bacterium]
PFSISLGPLSGAAGGPVAGSGTLTSDIGSGTITIAGGTISQSSVSISGTFTDSGGSPPCTGSVSITGSAAQGINPETTATAAQTQQSAAQAALSPTGVVGTVTTYVSNVARPNKPSNAKSGVKIGSSSARFSSRGLSAGDQLDVPFGVWIAGSYTDSEDDSVAPFEAERFNLTGGIDTNFADNLIVGLALGLESADTRTSANNGQSDSFGFTVAPYFAYLVNDAISVDFAVGYSRLSHDESRGPGRAITGDTNTRRLFAAGNGNWGMAYGNWYVSARGGITWLSSDLDAMTESDGTFVPASTFRIGQLSFGGEAAYSYDKWEPYVGATLSHAYTKTRQAFAAGIVAPSDDRSDLLVNVGVRFFGANDMTGGFEYSTLLLRDDYTEHSLQLNFRAEF